MGYGKIFDSIFKGSLGDHWEAWTTFVAMVVLSDRNGILPMTASALARSSSLPLDVVHRGLDILTSPDPESGSPEEDGRRVVRDGTGWRVVNKGLYRDALDSEHVRELNRQRQQRFRERRRNDNRNGSVTNNATSRDTDTDTNGKEANASFLQQNGIQGSFQILDVRKPDPVVAVVPLRDRGEFNVLESHVATWRTLYPAVDIHQELRKLLGWNLANPGKRKTRRGVENHITGWLAGAQDKATAAGAGTRRTSDEEHRRENLG